MLGRFSSAEVCCLNPAEREKEGRGRKQEEKVKQRNTTMGKVKKREVFLAELDCS